MKSVIVKIIAKTVMFIKCLSVYFQVNTNELLSVSVCHVC